LTSLALRLIAGSKAYCFCQYTKKRSEDFIMRMLKVTFTQIELLLFTVLLTAAFLFSNFSLSTFGLTAPLFLLGMAEIKSIAAIRDKWTRVTPQRAEDYKLGVQNPKRDWANEAGAAKANWKAGVDAAASKDLFAKGVAAAGSKKWQEKALAKGPGRFSEGVYSAGGDYEKGFAPFREAIARVDLGPKFPRRDPRNLERVKKVVDALVTAKTA
jgi:hypothetical protein